MTTLADLYQQTDHAAVTIEVRVGGTLLTDVIAVDWSFGIAKVPQATIRLSSAAPAAVVFFADVTIDAGFNGVTTRVFTGKLVHVNPDEGGTSIECQGLSYTLDLPYHKVVVTLSSITAQTAIENLLTSALAPFYTVTMPAWTIGTVVAQTLTFQTYGDAINKIAEVDGARWMEQPTGLIRVEVLDPIPSVTAWRKYFSMQLTGTTEAYPTGLAAADGRPRLRTIRGEQQLREVKNRCFVRGATYTQTNGDGSKSPIDVESDAQASSTWIINPDGTQAYNDELFSNELIDTVAKAATTASRIVTLKNRLNTRATAVIDGDPEVALGRTVYIADPDYSAIVANFFIESYRTSWSGDDFSTSLNLIGGENAGGSVNVSPFALFTFNVEREIIGDREWAVVTLDGRGSLDPDGAGIATWLWTDNQTPNVVSGSTSVVVARFDLAAYTSPLTVTLTVTDSAGASDSITLTIDLSYTAINVAVPALFWAADVSFSASPDGGATWNDQAAPGGDNVISVDALPPDGTFGVAVFGTQLGALYRTTDYCATALTLVLAAVGSPFVHVWADKNHPPRFWAVTQDGRLYRSLDAGLTFSLFDDLRIVLGNPNLRINRIATPAPDGVWLFGGDGAGRPLILIDPIITHGWVQAAIGGELQTDLLANPGIADLYIYEAASRETGELAIILNSATYPTAVYYTTDILGDGSAWKRATGLPVGKTHGRWIAPDLEVGKFMLGFDDTAMYKGDVTAGVMAVTAAAAVLQAGDAANHAIWLGGFIGGVANVYLIAAEGSTDGTIWKTWDRGATDGKLRPATGYPAVPAGANGKMIAIGAASSAGAATLWAQQTIVPTTSTANYARKTAARSGPTWVLKANPAAAVQYNVQRFKYLGGSFYRIARGDTDQYGYIEGGQLQRSTDGITWADVGPAPFTVAGSDWGVQDVAISADGSKLYLIASSAFSSEVGMEPEIHVSTDGGATWTLLWEEIGTYGGHWYNFSTLAVHPSNSNIIAVMGVRTDASNRLVCWSSTDAGATAFTRNAGASLSSQGYPQSLMLANGRIVIGYGNAVSRIFTTDDYGAAFTSRYNLGSASSGMWDIVTTGGAVFVLATDASSNPFILRSTDQGGTWTTLMVSTDLPYGTTDDITGLAASRDGTLFFCTERTASTNGRVWSIANAATVSPPVFADETLNLSTILSQLGHNSIAVEE